MIKWTAEYEDYNGNTRKEDFNFHLTRAEIAEMELSVEGGLEAMVNRISSARNGKEIVETFKKLILMSYGVKSPDGRRFIKNQEVRDDFAQTEAFSQLFMSLATDAEKAAAFFKGIVGLDKDTAEGDRAVSKANIAALR